VADGIARRAHDLLIQLGRPTTLAGVVAPEGAPAHLECSEALRLYGQQMVTQTLGLVHQDRAIRAHALPVAPAEQTPNGLAGGLPKQVPQRDVNAADGVGDRAAEAEPEHVMVQFLADALVLKRVLAETKRLVQCRGGDTVRVLG